MNIYEALEITVSSMLIVFAILLLLAGMVSLFRYIPEVERLTQKYRRKRKPKYIPFEKMNEDMQVAVLVATIKCQQDTKKDVYLKSIREI